MILYNSLTNGQKKYNSFCDLELFYAICDITKAYILLIWYHWLVYAEFNYTRMTTRL